MITNELNIKFILLGCIYTFFAQAGAWFQHNLQFKYPKLGPEWWGWYVAAIPITWLFLTATKYNVDGFGGSVWANRFVGFSIGIVVYATLTQIFFNQPISLKILIQLILAILILIVQLIWKQ